MHSSVQACISGQFKHFSQKLEQYKQIPMIGN